jgi:hypothetical protein
VVHGLVEVAEHVHVSPPQLHAHALLEAGGHRARSLGGRSRDRRGRCGRGAQGCRSHNLRRQSS